MYYELKSKQPEIQSILNSLVSLGYLETVPQTQTETADTYLGIGRVTSLPAVLGAPYGVVYTPPNEALSDFHRYRSNGMPIESNIEEMARNYLGTVEDRSKYKKSLQTAVKEYGHDQILEAFYQWSSSQGNFLGRNPVTTFLKNVGTYVNAVTSAPKATNPILDRVEQRVAYVTENRVFFTGDNRMKLALLLNDFGEKDVLQAFEDFYQDVDDRNKAWAHRNFLERAHVMVGIIRQKRQEAQAQELLLKQAYATAGASVEPEEEDEEL